MIAKSPLFILAALIVIVLLSGCDTGRGGAPGIIDDEPILRPDPPYEYPKVPPIDWSELRGGYPLEWFPPTGRPERHWEAIVIHHSATDRGNAAIFDDWHKHKGWEGVGYDFVIGNGKGSADGKVEVTFRWTNQIQGAHVGGTWNNWANEKGIGICLVGDFEKHKPTTRQMASAKKLVAFLRKRYGIPSSKIYGHEDTPGYTGGSVCPGRYFPMWQLR